MSKQLIKNVLVITDNDILLSRFRKLLDKYKMEDKYEFHFAYSPQNNVFKKKYYNKEWISPIDIKASIPYLISNMDMIFSLHCKQLFPVELLSAVKCINIHPGLNPYNRGWYPQVFSIINGMPIGATIHEIDEQLDHGPIICQREVEVHSWDTSLDVYNKVLDTELELLDENLANILRLNYTTFMKEEGNLNLKKDFNQLKEIDLKGIDTFQNHIDKLRALTHGDFSNAFFIDNKGNKVYITINLRKVD